jgi:hypothetical protein
MLYPPRLREYYLDSGDDANASRANMVDETRISCLTPKGTKYTNGNAQLLVCKTVGTRELPSLAGPGERL